MGAAGGIAFLGPALLSGLRGTGGLDLLDESSRFRVDVVASDVLGESLDFFDVALIPADFFEIPYTHVSPCATHLPHSGC